MNCTNAMAPTFRMTISEAKRNAPVLTGYGHMIGPALLRRAHESKNPASLRDSFPKRLWLAPGVLSVLVSLRSRAFSVASEYHFHPHGRSAVGRNGLSVCQSPEHPAHRPGGSEVFERVRDHAALFPEPAQLSHRPIRAQTWHH